MAEWPLVGRSRDLAYLRSLASNRGNRGAVLAAPAGSGKTRLAQECLHAAEHAGMTPLVVAASQSAAAVPLGAMASVLSAFGGVAFPADDPGAFLHNAVVHVISQARKCRAFVLVDDAHLLDTASAALVQQLAQHDEVFLLLTVRTRERAPDAVTVLWKDGLLERIDLAELEPDAVESLLTTVLGGPVDGAAVATLIGRSQGNLLYLRELVTAALADGTLRREHDLWRLIGESAPSDRLVELVEARLTRLTADERQLMELLAVGEPMGARELAGLSHFDVADGLEELGLISSRNDGQRLEVRLAHPVYGEVLRSRLSGLHSRRLARALAECVEGTGMRRRNDVLRVATWRLAGGGGQPAQLLAAATAARWQFDLPLALRLARAATAAGAGFDAELLTAQLLLMQGRPTESDELLARLCRESAVNNRTRAFVARADIAHMRARGSEMRRLMDEAGPSSDPELAAALLGRSVVAALLTEGPDVALAIPIPDFDESQGDAVFPLRLTRAICLTRQGSTARAEQELALVESNVGTSPHLGWWRFPYGAVLTEVVAGSGRLAESIDINVRQYEQGVRSHSAEVQLMAAWQLGTRMLQAGRLHTAARYAHETVALSEQLGYDICLSASLHLLALIQAQCQQAVEARRTLRSHDRLGDLTTGYTLGLIGEAAAWTAAAEGDVQASRDRLLETAEACRSIGDRTSAASALHALVRIGRAQDAVDGLANLAEQVDRPWEPAYARHARAVVDRDAQGLEDISTEFDRLGAALLAAEAMGEASARWERAGETRRAAAARRMTAALAEGCEGARTPALQGLGVRSQLSPSEQETARYAAAGHSNKLIAERLHLSVRTVEARLQAIYDKLGIHRRQDLAAALHAGPSGDDETS